MSEFLIYNLKTAVCLTVFYLFYKLLLSRETFHRVNRIVLLSAMMLAFVLPLCVITVKRAAPAEEHAALHSVMLGNPSLLESDLALMNPELYGLPGDQATKDTDWPAMVNVLFIIGISIGLLFTLLTVLRVLGVIRHGEKERLDGKVTLVKKMDDIVPFSWLKYIVISKKDLAESGRQIIPHERAHIELLHSLDLMLANICCCIQWFNPAMWLLRSELTAIHEYEADRAVLASGADPREYQMLLIKKAVGAGRYSIANSLNHSKLKNRITMMLQKKSSNGAMAKILLVIPLVCVALTAFARTEYVADESKVSEKIHQTEIQPDGEIRMYEQLFSDELISAEGEAALSSSPSEQKPVTVKKDRQSEKSVVVTSRNNKPVVVMNGVSFSADSTDLDSKHVRLRHEVQPPRRNFSIVRHGNVSVERMKEWLKNNEGKEITQEMIEELVKEVSGTIDVETTLFNVADVSNTGSSVHRGKVTIRCDKIPAGMLPAIEAGKIKVQEPTSSSKKYTLEMPLEEAFSHGINLDWKDIPVKPDTTGRSVMRHVINDGVKVGRVEYVEGEAVESIGEIENLIAGTAALRISPSFVESIRSVSAPHMKEIRIEVDKRGKAAVNGEDVWRKVKVDGKNVWQNDIAGVVGALKSEDGPRTLYNVIIIANPKTPMGVIEGIKETLRKEKIYNVTYGIGE